MRGVRVELSVERGLRLLRLVSAAVPRTVAAGQRIRVRARLRRAHGAVVTRTFSVRLPRDLKPGTRRLVLDGAAGPPTADYGDALVDELSGGGPGAPVVADSFSELATAVHGLARFDGIRARVGNRKAFRAYRDSHDRITGRLSIRLHVAR